MRRLRSRWTVVALVPAFFLAGFGLVTALAGSDDAAPTAAGAEPDGTGANDAPASAPGASTVTAVPTTTGQTGGAAAATTSPASATDGQGGSTTTPDGDGNGTGAPAPPPGTIEVDYGRWEDLFELSEMEIVPEFGVATVTGEFRYLGGGECSQLGAVELRGQFFSPSGQPIGEGVWESVWVTGDGAEVPQREPLYLEFYGAVSEAAESARIRFARVTCL